MKKSKLNRKHPMKRSAKPSLRKTAIGVRGKKRRQQDRECNDLSAFHEEFAGTPCWITGEVGDQAHHVAGRNHPLRHHRTNLLWVSEKGHRLAEQMDVLDVFDLKRRRDPKGWNDEVAKQIFQAKNGRKDWLPKEAA